MSAAMSALAGQRSQLQGLALCDWPLPAGQMAHATVLIVHGLGEHMGRYAALAQALNSWGYAVRSYDQYGHGASEGPRGGLPTATRLLDDLALVVDHTRATVAAGHPLLLLGHSMGGLVAARFVALQRRPVEALVLSSPALDPGLNPVQKLLVAVLPSLLPNLRVGNGLDARLISHDPAVVAAYQSDPLVHDRIAARLARFIADDSAAVRAAAPGWVLPTLLLYAGADKLVNPAGSRAFAAAAPPAVLSNQCFELLYHEIFNEAEPGRSQVLAALRAWLDARFAA
ncbi:MAG: alpha/beta hydrolase [Rhodoferax sp.]|nr:alpha/beta hydrolase [Rhodoferax sp.]